MKNLPNGSIRVFSPQTKDAGMLLMPELPIGYLCWTLVEKVGMDPSSIVAESLYPFKKYDAELLRNLPHYREDFFFFFLEEYYHSSGYLLPYLISLFERAPEAFAKKGTIVHSFKISESESLELMRKFPFVSLVIRTDAEYFFYQKYCQGKPFEEIPNVTYRNEDGEPVASFSEDVGYPLSEYLVPGYRNGVAIRDKDSIHRIIGLLDDDGERTDDLEFYRRPKARVVEHLEKSLVSQGYAMLTTGRGCKYGCTYCYRGVKYSKIRQIPLETIEADLEELKKYGFKTVYLYDDCFLTTNADRIDEIVKLLGRYPFRYQIAVRYEICTPAMFRKMQDLEISFVQIGLQSVSKATNAVMGRGFREEPFRNVVAEFKKRGTYVSVDTILWLPGESLAEFLETYNTALTMEPDGIVVNSLFLNPGTKLAEKVWEYGIEFKSSDSHNVPVISGSSTFSSKNVELAKSYVKRSMEKFPGIEITLR